MALPVVWLLCGKAHRLPLVDLGQFGVWATAGLCLFAFTATSEVGPHYTLSAVAQIPEPAARLGNTVAGLSTLLDDVASRHGLACGSCPPLSGGRAWRGQGLPQVAAGFDAARNRLLFEVNAYGGSKADVDAARPEVDRIKAEIEQALRQRFPSISVSDRRAAPGKTVVVNVFWPSTDQQFDQAFAVTEDVLRRAGFKIDKSTIPGSLHASSPQRVRVSALQVSPAATAWATRCRGDGAFGISIYAQSADEEALQRRIVGELEKALARAFPQNQVAADGSKFCP